LAGRDQTVVQVHRANQQADYDWGLSRFISEAQTLAKFKHPAIVPVYTTFPENRTAYMVMERITGESTTSAIRHQRYISEDWMLFLLGS
jgi:serine/threonine protein kinase